MFRWRQTLCTSINRHISALNSICDNQLQKNFNTSIAMADKFKLPVRYGDGEKSVW